jgi:hypothetical protein
MQNVSSTHLMDASLFDFKHIQMGDAHATGDLVFDQEDPC